MTATTGKVGALISQAQPIDTEVAIRTTREASQICDSMGGQYAERTIRGAVYSFSIAAQTLPVNASTLVSKISLYNPVGSGKLLEILYVEGHYVVATTVVNALGVYSSSLTETAAGTFTTPGVAKPRRVRDPSQVPAVGVPYSAYTHSGTPQLEAIVGGWGAVTDTGTGPCRKDFAGSLIVPPGIVISLAMTTAASTASGVTAEICWAEVPYVAAG